MLFFSWVQVMLNFVLIINWSLPLKWAVHKRIQKRFVRCNPSFLIVCVIWWGFPPVFPLVGNFFQTKLFAPESCGLRQGIYFRKELLLSLFFRSKRFNVLAPKTNSDQALTVSGRWETGKILAHWKPRQIAQTIWMDRLHQWGIWENIFTVFWVNCSFNYNTVTMGVDFIAAVAGPKSIPQDTSTILQVFQAFFIPTASVICFVSEVFADK